MLPEFGHLEDMDWGNKGGSGFMIINLGWGSCIPHTIIYHVLQ